MARTPTDLVTAGVTGHALTDRYLAKAYKEQLKVIKAAEEALAQGLVSDGMVAKQFIWGHRAALGRIADAGKALADIHPLGTSLAKENGVDLGKITEAGGIALPQPEISVFDGGR